MEKQQKKRWIKRGIFFSVLAICLCTCKLSVPTFIMSPYDVHCDSIAQIMVAERNVWYYKPLSDSLILKDSVRNIRFHVKEACAYDARMVDEIYFKAFLPWVKLYDTDDFKLFGIWFDHMGIRDKWDKVYGIWYNIGDDSVDQIFGGPTGWDNPEANFTYCGKRIKLPLPDTLYFSVWGRNDVYVDRHTYLSLSDENQMSVIRKGSNSTKRKLGEIIFVKTDSFITTNKRKPEGTKLLIKNIKKMRL